MPRLSKKNTKNYQQSLEQIAKEEGANPSIVSTTIDRVDGVVLLEGEASKMSPKTSGSIKYRLVKDKAGDKYLQLVSNTDGGIFSKAPISLQRIVHILEKQDKDRSFKSIIFKPVFVGEGCQSVNNVSFLVAVLRDKQLRLIQEDTQHQYLSTLTKEFHKKAKQLLSL